MLARIGIKANLLAQTRAKYFGKINAPRYNTSFYMLGWTPAPRTRSTRSESSGADPRSGEHEGIYNNRRLFEPQARRADKADPGRARQRKAQPADEPGAERRQDDFAYIPLHQQIVVWASRDNVDLAPPGNNDFQLRFVKMK